jgi:hypothetical protein
MSFERKKEYSFAEAAASPSLRTLAGLKRQASFYSWHIYSGPPAATVRHAYDAVGWNADPMPADRSL